MSINHANEIENCDQICFLCYCWVIRKPEPILGQYQSILDSKWDISVWYKYLLYFLLTFCPFLWLCNKFKHWIYSLPCKGSNWSNFGMFQFILPSVLLPKPNLMESLTILRRSSISYSYFAHTVSPDLRIAFTTKTIEAKLQVCVIPYDFISAKAEFLRAQFE